MSRQRFMYIAIIAALIVLLVVPAASAQVPPDFWGLTGNSGTTAGTHFLGTTDDQALELHVDGSRALRIEPNGTSTSPNIIGGIASNAVSPGIVGATIGGGGLSGGPNTVAASFGVVGGGARNQASGAASTVGGGVDNTADGNFASVGGGRNNETGADFATVSGGQNNLATSLHSTVGGGQNGSASNNWATVGGGEMNTASGFHATVGGGQANTASADGSTVGGGGGNNATEVDSTISGGGNNIASGSGATVGGGSHNEAMAEVATISGGGLVLIGTSTFTGNLVFDVAGTVGGGSGNLAGSDDGDPLNHTFATVGGGDFNTASGHGATVAGGSFNETAGLHATIAGGRLNAASADRSTVGGGELNAASGDKSTIGGGRSNTVSGEYGTIAGGGTSDPLDLTTGNRVTDDYGTVGGGGNNQAGSDDADPSNAPFATVGGGEENAATSFHTTIGGGQLNTASGDTSTVGGGFRNLASGTTSTVGGGDDNIASGNFSTVPGGVANEAAAFVSFAAGHNAKVGPLDTGAVVFGAVNGGALNSSDFASERPHEFAVAATGGFRFISGVAAITSAGAGSTKDVATAGMVDMTWTYATANRLAHVLGAFAPDGLNPIAFDSVSSDAATLLGTTLTFSHTVGIGSNRMLVVGVEAEGDYTVDCGVANVTYDAVSFTKAEATVVGSTYLQCVELWYLIAPNTGTADIVVTWNGVVDNRNGGGISLDNVAQQGPEATAAQGLEPATSITTSITTLTNGAVVVDAVGSGDPGSEFVTVEPGQTERYDIVGITDPTITTGCNLPPGSGTWECTSDRNAKVNFSDVNGLDVLELVSQLPIESWNYKSEDPSIRHIGPMAQDFYAAFGIGTGDKRIGNVDADGVALAAIQGLNLLVQEKDAQIVALTERVSALESAPATNGESAGPFVSTATVMWMLLGLLPFAVLATAYRRRGAAIKEA